MEHRKDDRACGLKEISAGKRISPKNRRFKHWEIIAFYLAFYDVFMVNFSYFLGLWLRFDFRFSQIPEKYFY